MHYEFLRPHRFFGVPDKYEFAHGNGTICVYDAETMAFVKEIPVGTRPDCHATSADGRFLYVACFEGLYCIDLERLAVVNVVDTGKIYAVNTLPDGDRMLVHDLCGGIQIVEHLTDMDRIRVAMRRQVIPNGVFRCEIGGKGAFTEDGRYYLCNGWLQDLMYRFDMQNDFAVETFVPQTEDLHHSDDLVLSADKTRAYSACHIGREPSFVAVTDIARRVVVRRIPTGCGTCGLTMTNDERFVVASNDADDSISVIDTATDEVVNTPCAREGFEKLGLKGYIQGISNAGENSIFVYDCSGSGALVRFTDVVNANRYVISYPGGRYDSKRGVIA